MFQNLEVPYAELDSSLVKNFFFKLVSLEYERQTDNQVYYRFQVTNLSAMPPKSWEISKTYQDFKKLHEDLEKQTSEEFLLFNEMMPKIMNMQKSTEFDFLKKRNDALFRYLQALVQRFTCHGEVLYNFIGFDSEKGNPNTPHLLVPFAGPSAYLRSSPFEKQKENVVFQLTYEESEEPKMSSFGKKSFSFTLSIFNFYIKF